MSVSLTRHRFRPCSGPWIAALGRGQHRSRDPSKGSKAELSDRPMRSGIVRVDDADGVRHLGAALARQHPACCRRMNSAATKFGLRVTIVEKEHPPPRCPVARYSVQSAPIATDV